MGVKLSGLVEGENADMDQLSGKMLAVDAFNMLYQFITTIRQPDGSPLTDSKGRVTSHLIGLFYRLSNLLKRDISLVFVFDGESHKLKKDEQERREDIKRDAEKRYKDAIDSEDIEMMKKYAGRTSRLNEEMIQESKELLEAMGIPWIQAPSEGEAQCARLVQKGQAFAVMSQDADSMLFGAPRIIKNLSISQRKKRKGALGSEKTVPEIIRLDKVLKELKITHEQLIVMGIMIGTDFNPGGIKGIGPKKALKVVKDHEDYDAMFKELDWSSQFNHGWKEVFSIFKDTACSDDYSIETKQLDKTKVMKILVEEHDFSEQRISEVCDEVTKNQQKEQKGLGDFF